MLLQTLQKLTRVVTTAFVVLSTVQTTVAQENPVSLRDDMQKAFRNAYEPLKYNTRSLPDTGPVIRVANLPKHVSPARNTPGAGNATNISPTKPNPADSGPPLEAPAPFEQPNKFNVEPDKPLDSEHLEITTSSDTRVANSSSATESGPVVYPAGLANPSLDEAPTGFNDNPTQTAAPETATTNLWWKATVSQPIDVRPPEEIFPELLVQVALQNSPRILAISQQPLIQETEIGKARAEFDPEIFLRTQFDDRVDPVGNQLTTGGLPFLEDHIWTGDSGIRKKLYSGGQFELKQELGFQNSNSNFFDPQDQGTATLRINYSQPLLRGRGKYFNRSQILIAQVGTGITWDKFSAELQDELTKIVEAYWSLYYSRSVLLQKKRNVDRGQVILDRLEGRSGLDSLPSQIARARSAVQSRRTEMANAVRDVKNAETEIRRLVNSPQALQANANELVPIETPITEQPALDLEHVISDSMEQRPEVKEALKRAKIAIVQRNISRNELLPELNLIFNTYVAALEADSDVPTAWTHQFTRSTPGYAVGLEFAVPYGRRAAKARLTRQQVVLNQIRSEIDQVLLEVVAESQIAYRRVVSAHRTMMAAVSAIEAARADLDQNQARWVSFGLVEGDLAEGLSPTTLLDQLIDAQQRLTNTELTYSQALLEFKISEIDLRRVRGTLLNHQQVSFNKNCGPCGPEINVYSGGFQQR